jgi:hypothetical protein
LANGAEATSRATFLMLSAACCASTNLQARRNENSMNISEAATRLSPRQMKLAKVERKSRVEGRLRSPAN